MILDDVSLDVEHVHDKSWKDSQPIIFYC